MFGMSHDLPPDVLAQLMGAAQPQRVGGIQWVRPSPLLKAHREIEKRAHSRYPSPVPERFQHNARMRRLRQQHRDGRLSTDEYEAACARVRKETGRQP